MNMTTVENKLLNVASIVNDFPILQQTVNGKKLVYLDNSATTQKPFSVINAITNYYIHQNANVHRGAYRLSDQATVAYEAARKKVAQFIQAKHSHEIIFTRGCTEAINLVATSYGLTHLKAGDEMIVSVMEHHSNLVPWQIVCEKTGAVLRTVTLNDHHEINITAYEQLLNEKTKFIAINHISNALGVINPIKKMIALAHTRNIPVLIDGAQAIPHQAINIQELDCDFYTFSGHKMYAPMGIGVLYGKEKWLEKMPPYQTGGGMVSQVSITKTTFKGLPEKFEAGTPNVAEALGLAAAIDYLQSFDMQQIIAHEENLLRYAVQQLQDCSGVTIIGTPQAPVISFIMADIHPHDIATVLDSEGIAIRAGHHCAMPLMEFLGVPATARISFGIYNTTHEVDLFINALQKCKAYFYVK